MEGRERKQPAPRWLRALAWGVTVVALGLQALSVTVTRQALSSEQVLRDGLALLGILASPLLALLALAYGLATTWRAELLQLRGVLSWLLVGVVAVAGFPISCATSALNALRYGTNYLCHESQSGCSCATDRTVIGKLECAKAYACCVAQPERIGFLADDPAPYAPGRCECFDLKPGETCQSAAESRGWAAATVVRRCPPP